MNLSWLRLCLTWGHIVRGTGWGSWGLPEASCCVFERILEVVKHEPKPVIHMEKLLLTAASWVGWNPRGSLGQSRVLARFMESQMLYLSTSSVALPAFLSERKLSPSSCPEAKHFISFLYATGAF